MISVDSLLENSWSPNVFHPPLSLAIRWLCHPWPRNIARLQVCVSDSSCSSPRKKFAMLTRNWMTLWISVNVSSNKQMTKLLVMMKDNWSMKAFAQVWNMGYRRRVVGVLEWIVWPCFLLILTISRYSRITSCVHTCILTQICFIGGSAVPGNEAHQQRKASGGELEHTHESGENKHNENMFLYYIFQLMFLFTHPSYYWDVSISRSTILRTRSCMRFVFKHWRSAGACVAVRKLFKVKTNAVVSPSGRYLHALFAYCWSSWTIAPMMNAR